MVKKYKYLVSVVALIAIMAMAVMGCAPAAEEEEEEPPVRTTGPWLNEINIQQEADSAKAISKLSQNEADVFAFASTDASLFKQVVADPNLSYSKSYGSYNEFTFNPIPTFTDGRFNPFGYPKIREALNWLVDRDYIAGEIAGGLAVPKYTALTGTFADAKDRYPDLVQAINSKYAYNKAKAIQVINDEMVRLGATKGDTGKWTFGGAELEIILLIRTEDQRKLMGAYLGAQLEDAGFKCRYDYKTAAEASPIWLSGDPKEGKFHIYTGGWVTTAVARDQGSNFAYFYTKLGRPEPLWQAYTPTAEFYDVSEKLWNNDFTTLAERKTLFDKALKLSMEDSARVWLVDNQGFSTFRKNVAMAADQAGGIYGSWMWALTAQFRDAAGKPILGGNLRVLMPSMLPQPPNPIAGSNWVYDMFWIRATGDNGWAIDTRDGLRWPHRFQKAEVTVKTGLPVGVSTELGHGSWCSLSFADNINVPLDAWSDWDAVSQTFITVRDRFGPTGMTALRKSVVYYPKDIFTVPLHDGSTLSAGDFILGAILTFDRGKEKSPIYDPAAVAALSAFLKQFKGVKFITDNPDYGLIIETYSDLWYMDAELCVTHWFPYYAQGPGMWHTLALGIRAEAEKKLAFSSSKAKTLNVEWMSFVAGPSLEILKAQLNAAKTEKYIPYKPTMSLYVTEEEVTQRYANLEAFSTPVTGYGHFWVASGPFVLKAVYPLQNAVQLVRFDKYPDKVGRFDFLMTERGTPSA